MVEKLKLEQFIYQVKKELLDAQSKHEGEDALFVIKDVELEISVVVSFSGGGKVNVVVAELGSNLAKEQVHKVKLTLAIAESEKPTTITPVNSPWGMFEQSAAPKESVIQLDPAVSNQLFQVVRQGGPNLGVSMNVDEQDSDKEE